MMRTLAAILVLSPVLASAQSTAPAQPVSTPTLEARLLAPTGTSADNRATAMRVSTGVTPPQLVSAISLSGIPQMHLTHTAGQKTVVVSLIVDANGEPANAAIARSGGGLLDQSVLAAVNRTHFKPGTLNGVPTAVPVNLSVTLAAQGNE